jgi:hypothetical protein
MKNPFFAIAFLLITTVCSTDAFSQVKFGIKGGLNLANFDIENTNNSDALLTPQAGIVLYSNLNKPVFFQTGLLYNQKGTKSTVAGIENSFKYNFIELPANVGFQIPVGNAFSVSPYVGAFAGYAISGKAKIGDVSFDIFDTDFQNLQDEEFDDKRMDYGANVGVGLHFNNKLIISGQYAHGLSNLGSDNNKAETRTTTLGLTFLF